MQKKTPVSFESPYGSSTVTSYSFDRPCILGIVPMSGLYELNGYLNKFMQLLQVRRYPSTDSDVDIKDLPFDILVRAFNDKVDIMILDAIPSNNITEAKRIARNINILSYCNGNNTTAETLISVHKGLIDKGYSSSDADEILSQVAVLQIVDNYHVNRQPASIPYAHVVVVQDVYDTENPKYFLEEKKETKFKDNPFIHIESQGDNDHLVLFKSFGEGSLSQEQNEHNFERDYVYTPIISSLMSLYLIRFLHYSINNIELKNNVSIKDQIEMFLVLINNFFRTKRKHPNNYTKEDLNELNVYLMKEIQKIFKQYIPVKTLSKEEKGELDQRDEAIRNFHDLNESTNIEREINHITSIAENIINFYDNYGDDDIAYTEYNNAGHFDYKKGPAIRYHLDLLFRRTNNFISALNSINISDNISTKMQLEINNYIQSSLDKVKSIVLNDKIQQIIQEYGDSERTYGPQL